MVYTVDLPIQMFHFLYTYCMSRRYNFPWISRATFIG